MRKKQAILIAAVFILGVTLGLLSTSPALTGKAAGQDSFYTHTTAICNPEKECIDVVVTCKNGEVTKLEPVSDLIKFGQNWQDPRKSDIKFCK